jgi:HEAT repeat protein
MRDLMMKALEEERVFAEVTDDGHDWPTAEEIGRSSEALAVVERFSVSNDLIERAVAAHVLATFVDGNDNRNQVKEAVAILARMLEQGGNLHLEWSIVDALRLAGGESTLEPLLTLSQSHSANIRKTVAMGLHGAMVNESIPAGVQALIRLTGDVDASVRDWATFGLAELEENSPEIRAALWARVEDPDYDTRCEALVGLASRHDLAVTSKLAAELGSGHVGKLVVEAAKDLAQPALLKPLQALQAWWDVDHKLLEEALQVCGSEAR